MTAPNWTKLGRMLRARTGMRPSRAARVGIRIARLIVANQVLLARTVFALLGQPVGLVAWSEAERRAIGGAVAYANLQWLAGLDAIEFGVDTEAARAARRLAFDAMASRCGERLDVPLERRPANALNVEIGQPLPRCRLRTPPEWSGFDPRGARWLLSGGSPLILAPCSRSRCPKLTGAT